MQRSRSEEFQAQTFPYMDALYADALCLTGSREGAVALVIDAYNRAFQGYKRFRCRRVPAHLRQRAALAWLYENLHAAFCEGILRRSAQDMTLKGGQL